MTLDELAVKIGEWQEQGFGNLEVQTFDEDEKVFVGCWMVAPIYSSESYEPLPGKVPERIGFFWSWDDA